MVKSSLNSNFRMMGIRLWTTLLAILSVVQTVIAFVIRSPGVISPTRFKSLAMNMKRDTKIDSSNNHNAEKRTICIIGGGFGGLYTALKLSESVDPLTNVCLIEPKDRFVFLPLLYELAVKSASVVEVAPKYNDLLEGTRIKHIQGSVSRIDFENQRCDISSSNLQSESGRKQIISSITYDQLIIAAGNQPRLDIVQGARQYALPFYRLQDADVLQQRLEDLKNQKKGLVRVTVMGAGYSGVELAVHVAQYLGKSRGLVTIVDRNDNILPSSPPFNRNISLK